MNRPAHPVTAKPRHVERLGDHPLADERRVAAELRREREGAAASAAASAAAEARPVEVFSRLLRRVDPHFRNLAVYGYYEGARRLPEPDDTNIFIESFEHGWFWNIPLHTGWTSVGAVVDARYGQEGIARVGAAASTASMRPSALRPPNGTSA